MAIANSNAVGELQGSVDIARHDQAANQVHIEGWAWDAVTKSPPDQLLVFIKGHDYKVNNLILSERKDVQAALGIAELNTGFSAAITLLDPLPGGLHSMEVKAIFQDGRSVKLLSWGGETPRIEVDKPRVRHWILLALVTTTIVLAYIPMLRRWGDKAGRWINQNPSQTTAAIGGAFVLLVAFGVTGSSLQLLLQGPQGPYGLSVMDLKGSNAKLFKLREVRSDEWGVLAANTLAQWNHSPRFPVVNSNIGLEGQNMGVIGMTGVPIAQPAAMARPATWGYFFLPLRQALSWHWQLPFFACLFFLWKTLNLLRPTNLGFNLTLAVVFCTAPYAAGWSLWPLYATAFPLALFVTAATVLKSNSSAKSLPLGIAMGVLAAAWVLVLYPPWQITVGTFFAAFTMGWAIDHRDELKFSKTQWISFGTALLVASLLIGSWWLDTTDAIEKIKATIYPGARNALNGGEINPLWALRGYTNPETLTFGAGPHANQSEISSYILFPLPLLALGLLYCGRLTTNRWTLRACIAFIAAWSVFRFFGVPLWLAEITLWSRVPSGRLDLAIGLACTVLFALILPNNQSDKPVNGRPSFTHMAGLFIAIGSAAIVFFELKMLPKEVFPGNSLPFLWSILLAGFFSAWWMMRGQMRAAVTVVLLLNIVSTLGFNPLSRAPRSVDLSPSTALLASAHTSQPLRTLVVGGWGVGPMTLAAVGIPTVNGVLYYPQRSFWEGLGLASTDWSTVNRYQHFGIALSELPTMAAYQVRTNQLDSVDLTIDPRRFDFKTTGAQRVVSLENDAISLRKSPHLTEIGQHRGLFWFAVRKE